MRTSYVLLICVLRLLAGLQAAYGQERTQQQQWYAFFSTIKLTDKYSLYTDYQYIPEGFAIARVGLLWQLPHNLQANGGYTAGLLPAPGSGSNELRRHEHRPWAQLVLFTRLHQNLTLSHRLRYDMRFLQHAEAGELQQKYKLTNRLRFQESARLNLPSLRFKEVLPYLLVYEELLLNFENEHTYHTFDQNRLALMLGGQYKSTRLQLGYMHRYVHLNVSTDNYVTNHTFTLWLFHNFDLRKQERKE